MSWGNISLFSKPLKKKEVLIDANDTVDPENSYIPTGVRI